MLNQKHRIATTFRFDICSSVQRNALPFSRPTDRRDMMMTPAKLKDYGRTLS